MTRYWFRPRKYGYGARPTTWEGYLLIAVFVVIVGALSLALTNGGPPSQARILTHFLSVGLLAIVFVWICWKKTDGEWRWRWGGED